ncbi:MAG: long-chain fatty acid--CoA ligase [Syntrophus sp. (in: bacteria)]|nr:long-chain fatty acid--CoA ligase [Syntrophus sp. (in: bacteria)]
MTRNLSRIFRNQAGKYKNRLAVEKRQQGVWQGWSWTEYYDTAKAVGLGLYRLGIRKGDRVALLSDNRLEWLAADMGILGIGACTVPIYVTLLAPEVAYIINNSGSKIFIAENQTAVRKALDEIDKCPTLEKIVVMETDGCDLSHPLLLSFEELVRLGRTQEAEEPGLFEKFSDAIDTDDLATLVYTSGTTGNPKGAMITHGNILAVFAGLDAVVPAYETDVTTPFLPLCHVFERIAGHFYGMKVGVTAHYAQSLDTIVEDIKTKRPTIILAVPRVCEKIYARIVSKVKQQPAWKQRVFAWAGDVGARVGALRERKKPVPTLLALQHKLAFNLVYKKLNEALGGRVRWMTAAGAPLSREIADFFNASGIFVIEGYGLTETTAPASLNVIDDYRFGTTGKPLPCNEIKIAPDGEILIKGGNVIRGYWKMPEETKNAFTPDGWLMTGDIGRLDEDGFLAITDRKKDLIVTSGGKNIAPQKIEGLFLKNPLFEHVLVIGDRRRYLTALMTLNFDEAARLAREAQIDFTTKKDLLAKPDFLALVDRHVQERNQQLARFETIKTYRILPESFSQEAGELTPSLKLKKKVIMDKYQILIENMYSP